TELRKMFTDEARLSSSLHHGNVVQVIDFGTHDGEPYLVMEHVIGVNLAELRAHAGKLEPRIALRILCDLARGLHYVHTQRGKDGSPTMIVHRDVSPENVLLSITGEVKLADFGVARARERLAKTQAGVIK